MKSNKDYIAEESYKRIKELLDGSALDKLIGSKSKDNEEDHDLEFDDLEFDGNEELAIFPGLLEFIMDTMHMNLFMHIKAPVNSDNKITIEDIKKHLVEVGPFCEAQADWFLINDIYNRVINEGELIPETVIAKGQPVEFVIPEHILIKESLQLDFKPESSESQKVDYHHIKSFIPIAKGEFLGNIVPEMIGSDGIDLLGKVIPAPKKYINNLSIGFNVYNKNGKIYSSIDGALKVIKGSLIIDPILDISTDVNYSTGDIDFKGDVKVNGSIREGFLVNSLRDIFVTDSIEPTNINCGNSLFVEHGIIGTPEYKIICEGNVEALHIEHAIIECKGDLKVKNSVVNSEIRSLGTLNTEEKCSIIGGIYYLQNGINTGNIGNSSGVETHIHLGVDYTVENKLGIIQKTIGALILEMDNLQRCIISLKNRDERNKIKLLFLKLKNRQNSLNNYCRTLLSRLDRNDRSSLIVHGSIYPGTYIEICHISYIVKTKLSRVKFNLNKSEGKIEYHPL